MFHPWTSHKFQKQLPLKLRLDFEASQYLCWSNCYERDYGGFIFYNVQPDYFMDLSLVGGFN